MDKSKHSRWVTYMTHCNEYGERGYLFSVCQNCGHQVYGETCECPSCGSLMSLPPIVKYDAFSDSF